MNKIYWIKKAASPPKILHILFILSKNKVGACRAHLSGHFFQSVQGPKKGSGCGTRIGAANKKPPPDDPAGVQHVITSNVALA